MRLAARQFPHGFQQNCLNLLHTVHKWILNYKRIGRAIASREEFSRGEICGLKSFRFRAVFAHAPPGELPRNFSSPSRVLSFSSIRDEPHSMKEVILNADDFGLTLGVNEGIIRAHRDGILSSTTLMANGLEFSDAVARAKSNPKLGVGCHLVLIGGKSVAPAKEIPSLVDANGNFPATLPSFVARVTSGRIRKDDVATELRAQIEKIRAAGIEPTHVDTHKHTHAHPRVLEVVCRVAKECGIKRIRQPIESFRNSWLTTASDRKGTSTQVVAAAAVRSIAPKFRSILKKYGLTTPKHFLGLAMTGQVGPETLTRMIESLEEGTTEIMFHPGVYDDALAKTGTRLLMQRELELQALTDPGVRDTLDQRGVRIISYRELH
jgi:chitin disaccharide deacetylase